MSSPEEQLFSFFAYSIFVYPAANYLASSQRKYGSFWRIAYTILFLGAVAWLHIVSHKFRK